MLSIISITLAFMIGIAWGLYLEFQILVLALIFLSSVLLMILIFSDKFVIISKYLIQIIFICFIFLVGYFYSSYKISNYTNKYDEGLVNFDVTIISHYKETNYYYKYYAKNQKNDKFLIYVKKSKDTEFEIGTKLHIKGEYELPDVMRNQGGFNYKYYLNSNNVYGIIYVSNFSESLEKDKNLIYYFQNLIRNKLMKMFPSNFAGILNGMLIGETTDISDNIFEWFNKSGITHLLAVSGSNVVLVITISKFLFSKIVGKKYSNFFNIIFILFFVLLSGSTASVVRAGLMAILEITANIIIKKSNSINNVFTSALIMLIINPITLSNVGFILSFVATLGIIILSKRLKSNLDRFLKFDLITETLSVTISAQLVLLPIMAYYFNSISLLSIFTNLIIVPLSSVLTILGFVTLFVSLISIKIAKIPAIIVFSIIKFIVFVAKMFSEISILNFIVITPKVWMIISYYILLYLLFFKSNAVIYNLDVNHINVDKDVIMSKRINNMLNMKNHIIVALFFVCVFFYMVQMVITKNYIQLSAIDVGQGDSFLIETSNNRRILVDGGGSEKGDYDVGENILVPYLLDKGIKRIDLVIISHAHADHIDGIYTVIEKLSVKKVIIGPQMEADEKILKLYKLCKDNNIPIICVSKGDMLVIDDIKFNIIYPSENIKTDNINNLSLVMKVEYANKSILFTGDIENEAEKELVGDLKSDILKVAHHGANTSSSDYFINRVKPKIAIIGVSETNTYGHPNKNVLERLKQYAKVYMTKDSGEIGIRIYNDSSIYVKECIK